jgi:predicted SprT family Zn-dependent metalloprotease
MSPDDLSIQEKQTRCFELMKQHLSNDWAFSLNMRKYNCGFCDRRKKLISVNYYFIKSAPLAEIEDTVLHEIAHAKTNGAHDYSWKIMCKSLGAKPTRTTDVKFETPSGKWSMSCPTCGWTRDIHKLTRNRRYNCICSKCRKPPVFKNNLTGEKIVREVKI